MIATLSIRSLTPLNRLFMFILPPICRLVLAYAVLALVFTAPVAARPSQPTQVIEQIDFRDVTVGDALKILADQSNLNIIASKDAADIHVTMFLRRVTPLEVIQAISKTYNLWYQRDDNSNIVRLYTVKEYRLEQVEFKKEETEIFTLKNAKNALDLAETIQNLFSSRVRLSYGDQNQMQQYLDLQQRFKRFDMVDGRTKQQSSSGGSSTGNNSNTTISSNQNISGQGSGNQQFGNQGSQGISSQGFGNNQGYAQNNQNSRQNSDDQLGALGNVIGGLNTTPQQSGNGAQQNGQAGISNLANQFTGDAEDSRGLVDTSIRHQSPIYVGVIKHQNRVLVRTRDLDAMAEIKAIAQRLDIQSSMLLMEVKVLSIDLSDGYDSLFDFRVKSGDFKVSSLGGIGGALGDGLLTNASAAFSPAMLATVVSNNFETRLQLLEKENRVTQLATPVLLTSNQEVSRFFVGQQIPIITGYSQGNTTVTGNNNSTTIIQQPAPEYTPFNVGKTLLLTPNINADNTVSIQILVEQSEINKDGATILVSESLLGSTNFVEKKIDTVLERTFSGSVIAKDSTSVAVGGLIEEGATNVEKKTPILGDIPLLGFFFRDEAQTRTRTELVIIIKPHIINSPTEAASISQNLMLNNSIHPNANAKGNLNVYSNPDQQHKGYKLEQPFKQYNNQDSLDRYQWDNPNPRR